MRILVLSMLRIGDAMMHMHLIRQLKKKYPGSRIEMVLNDEFSYIEPLLSQELDGLHYFPRQKMQKIISSRESHLLEPIWMLEEWIQSISQTQIDLMINMTHTSISGYIMGLIPACEKQGLVSQNKQSQLLGNAWLQYLNTNFPSGQKSDFHYVDILANIFDIKISRESYQSNDSGRIFIQPLTSDLKKNWPLALWRILLDQLRSVLPSYQIQVLAAPSEVQKLLPYFKSSDISVLSLKEALESFKNCELLISGDTSLVHLATLTRTRSLVISLGSSDPVKTGPYLIGSEIISGKSDCRPCLHTQNCNQSTHLCAESISLEQVINQVLLMIQIAKTIQLPSPGTEGVYEQENRKPSRNTSAESRDCL